MPKILNLSITTIAFIVFMDLMAQLTVMAADPAAKKLGTGQAATKTKDNKAPLDLRWSIAKDTTLSYDFEQRVEINSNVGHTPKAPIQIHGRLQARSLPAREQTSLILDATRDDLQHKAQAKNTRDKATAAKPKKVKKSRGFFSCNPPPAAKQAQKPKRKIAPKPAATPDMHARFVIDKNGALRSTGPSSGGQTELMMRLLFPIPQKAIAIGAEEKTEIDVSPVGRRFPMLGHRLLKVEELVNIKGQRCARIVATVTMSGEGRGQSKPGQAAQMKGKMQLTATTHALFAIDAGYFREAQCELDFSLQTERVVNGQSQKVSLKQHQSSAVVLHTPPDPKSKANAKTDNKPNQP